MDSNDIFRGYGIEVTLPEADSFLKVKETLTRIGILSKKNKTLYQSVHILHKKGRYVIIHFLELFAFDGKNSNISDIDIQRRNLVVSLLQDWGLVHIVNNQDAHPIGKLHSIHIIPYKHKSDYTLVSKYGIGK